MKLDIMRKWVRALRSGKFEQYTGGALRDVEGWRVSYCCLGVLCELHRTSTKTKMQWNGSFYHDTESFPPRGVLRWAGLRQQDPLLFLARSGTETATALNDNSKRFTTIAAAIERTQKAGKLK